MILALLGPFAVAYLLTAFLRRAAPSLGLMDKPDPRKVHTTPTPRAGGLAIFAALILAWPLLPASFGGHSLALVMSLAGVIVLLGLVDDLRPLPWWLRLGVQTMVATVLVWDLPCPAIPGVRFLAGFWLVAMINAFNMLDNMDALSAGTAWIITLAFMVLALTWYDGGWGSSSILPLVTLGAVAGFLVHNFPPARIFMGDAGSTLLGLLVGLFSLEFLVASRWTLTSLLIVLLICAVPIYDQTSVVLLRLSQGRSPFHPDRQHFSHRITDRGWSKPAAVFWIHALGLASGAFGVLLYTRSPMVTLIAALLGLSGWLSLAWYEFGSGRRSR